VFSAYRVPEDIEGSRLSADLDRLIAKYSAQFGEAPESTDIQKSIVVEPEEAAPYTLAETLDGLFIDESRLKSILDLWEWKTNVILQPMASQSADPGGDRNQGRPIRSRALVPISIVNARRKPATPTLVIILFLPHASC
jgi:hypothetical protein